MRTLSARLSIMYLSETPRASGPMTSIWHELLVSTSIILHMITSATNLTASCQVLHAPVMYNGTVMWLGLARSHMPNMHLCSADNLQPSIVGEDDLASLHNELSSAS